VRRPFRAIGPAAVSAGVTAFLLYAFVMLPLQVTAARHLGLSDAESGRWILVVWAGGALTTIALSLWHRQPLAITWSVLGLVYLASFGQRFTLPELVGANLVAGVLMLGLALLGAGERVMRLIPVPVVVGMFAGSVLEYLTGAVAGARDDLPVAAATLAGYAAARALGARRVPPVALAALAGLAALAASGRLGPLHPSLAPPTPAVPDVAFSPDAILTLSPTLAVLALAVGNVQGLGLLAAEGYRVPVTRVSVAIGATSIVNALLGGHQATVGRATSAIVGGREAGPPALRYRAAVVSGVLALLIALGAGAVTSAVGALPASFVAMLTGLALVSAFEESLARAFAGQARGGAVVAFVVAATPFSFGGVGSSAWALVAGLLASAGDPDGPIAAYRRRRSPSPADERSPRSAKARSEPATRSLSVALTSTSPGAASAQTALATRMGTPSTLDSRRTTSPV
jgi:benzoate membrane transport protein